MADRDWIDWKRAGRTHRARPSCVVLAEPASGDRVRPFHRRRTWTGTVRPGRGLRARGAYSTGRLRALRILDAHLTCSLQQPHGWSIRLGAWLLSISRPVWRALRSH